MIARVLLACALLALAAGPAHAAPSGATAVVDHFYNWYFTTTRRDRYWGAQFPQAKAYFDPTLYTLVQTALTRESAEHSDIIDFDPFVNAQVYAASFQVGTATVRGVTTYVPVTLPIQGRHGVSSHLTMMLRYENGSYRIYDIDYTAFHFRSFLQQALKSSGH